ncbi:N-acetyl-alpha-D-glucosaminyl L-malate synthase BshA [bacterium]|nr:N-acetyl-alpha-D-glucosaminyl L-malate synthase BshA [bacterium]MCI0606208.1 N-acetyl-alpha-D-glucosaminyl L-malate synthase BshA [bacterium]
MKIGITCYPTYGGSGVVATELGKELAVLGHEIHFVSYALPIRLDKFNERIFFHEVDMLPYPLFQYPPYDLALAAKMYEIANYAGLDLFHVHYALPHAISAYLAKSMVESREVKIITTLHGTDITLVGMDRSYFPITKFGIKKSDGVTTVSKYLQTLTQTQVGRQDVEVIPNFVDTDLFKKPEESKCSRHVIAPGGEPILLHASNFRPVKRIINIIEIFERVLKKMEARLVFVGDGPERSVAERYCRDNKLTEKVLFLGRQDNLPDLMGCADVFLLPSELESFGLVALEAMACQVPVVATIVGGLPEVVVHGETGFLANLGDVDKMAEYSLEILRNSSLRQRLGENGRRRAIEVFDQKKIVPLYEKYYEKVLGN